MDCRPSGCRCGTVGWSKWSRAVYSTRQVQLHHIKANRNLFSFQETAATSGRRRRWRKEPASADTTTVTAAPEGSNPTTVSKPTAAESDRTGR